MTANDRLLADPRRRNSYYLPLQPSHVAIYWGPVLAQSHAVSLKIYCLAWPVWPEFGMNAVIFTSASLYWFEQRATWHLWVSAFLLAACVLMDNSFGSVWVRVSKEPISGDCTHPLKPRARILTAILRVLVPAFTCFCAPNLSILSCDVCVFKYGNQLTPWNVSSSCEAGSQHIPDVYGTRMFITLSAKTLCRSLSRATWN
jgi:hypothetical protein